MYNELHMWRVVSLVFLPANMQRGKGHKDKQWKGKLLMCKNISCYITFITNKDTTKIKDT